MVLDRLSGGIRIALFDRGDDVVVAQEIQLLGSTLAEEEVSEPQVDHPDPHQGVVQEPVSRQLR